MSDHLDTARVHVAVGVIIGTDGRILVSRRAAGQHLGGLWEFPGGKLEPGETVTDALARELREELAIEVTARQPLCRITHNYADKAVLLDVWKVTGFTGVPSAQEGQPLRWLKIGELLPADFPEANRAIIRSLQLPDHLAIYQLPAPSVALPPDPQPLLSLIQRMPAGALIRLRHNHSRSTRATIEHLLAACSAVCQSHNVRLVLDFHMEGDKPAADSSTAIVGGFHVNSGQLALLSSRPVADHLLFGASCHSAEELSMAEAVGADYVLLSPVKTTRSHPETRPLGWERFAELQRPCGLAVYALGGMTHQDLATAQAYGARGIAGLSLFTTD